MGSRGQSSVAPRGFCGEHTWVDAAPGRLTRCATCSVVASLPVPRAAYDEAYFTDGANGGYDFDTQFACDHDAARFDAELTAIGRAGVPTGSLLDVGCATGGFLVRAHAKGWSVSGVESAPFARREAVRRTGATVVARCEELPEGMTFDLVTLHHVLEHVHDPVAFLRDSVAPRVGKRLLVEVPNFASLASRVYGASWEDLRPEQHVWQYVPGTLSAVIEAAGFRICRVYTLWRPLWSLRSAVELSTLIAGRLRRVDRRWECGRHSSPGASARRQRAYRRPTGWRRAAVGLSHALCRPFVAALDAHDDGERLVVEAER